MTKNYLAAAEVLGAEIRSAVEVGHLARTADRWQVTGQTRTGPGPADVGPETVLAEADHVVLAGGTVASTLLLQRSGISNPHLGRHVSGNADLPIGAFLRRPTDVYQGVVMDTVTFDFLRPETEGPRAPDKFIIVSQHMLPLSTLVNGHGGDRAPDAWGLAKKHRFADFGRHFVGLAVIGLDDQEGVIEGPEVHASDGVRLLPLRYVPTEATTAVWDRAKQVCRDAVEADGGTFIDLARELANPQTAHPLGGARMADDPTDGVVDADGFVHGATELSVLDGAFVPSAVGVNPSLTIAALVERAMARRVTALGRPDAADLRPADVLHGSGRPVRPPAPGSRPSGRPAGTEDRLPATGLEHHLLPGAAALAAGTAAFVASRRERERDLPTEEERP